MTATIQETASPVLTYDDYMAEGEVFQRYDIIDGVRVVTNPTRRHQDIVLNLAQALRDFERRGRAGKVILSPADVLIQRGPLRTRQPDVLFISNERLAANPPSTDPAPLDPAPELVIEVLSPRESRRSRAAKIADYCAVDVRECWIVQPRGRTVEVLRLGPEGAVSLASYRSGERVVSARFPGLSIEVDHMLEE